MKMKSIWMSSLLLLLVFETPAWAWGRRGHALVCETAAYLVADLPKNDFLKNHSFDLSFYCNVPDFFWKDKDTYKKEFFHHFMDMEIFDRATRGSSIKDPMALDRKTFEKEFPMVQEKAGRAWWRIRELFDRILAARAKLVAASNKPMSERHRLQGEWIVPFGILGHYVGDMAMPFHTTENHNGEITKQAGIHSFYEDTMVNELYHTPNFNLNDAVWKAAQARWKKERASLARKSIMELLRAETDESIKGLAEPLTLDRKIGRDPKKLAPYYKKILVDRIAAGAVYLAEYYRRATGFDFDDNKFFVFKGEPKFIPAAE